MFTKLKTLQIPTNRRQVVQTIILSSMLTALPKASHASTSFLPTSPQVLGPYYPLTFPNDIDFDLTQFGANATKANGQLVDLDGRVLDPTGQPLAGALVEIWQADMDGRYNHPYDRRSRLADKNFQGYAQLKTDKSGFYRFLTIKPGAYPIGRNTYRPPHIHFKVTHKDFKSLVTQMYFASDPLNERDFILQRAANPKGLIVDFAPHKKHKTSEVLRGTFNIVLTS